MFKGAVLAGSAVEGQGRGRPRAGWGGEGEWLGVRHADTQGVHAVACATSTHTHTPRTIAVRHPAVHLAKGKEVLVKVRQEDLVEGLHATTSLKLVLNKCPRDSNQGLGLFFHAKRPR